MIMNYLKGSYSKFKDALLKTRSYLDEKIKNIFSKPIDEESLDQLEQALYEADLGVQVSKNLTNKVKQYHLEYPQVSSQALFEYLQKELIALLQLTSPPMRSPTPGIQVILVVGVNGNGKTTTTAKLAKKYKDEGRKVLVCAADTFRAAAMEQLEQWANSIEVDLVKGNSKSDPAAVVFDALSAAKARNADVVIIDTAGRLHTKTHLMQELEKIKRICKKVVEHSPHETLLVLDATMGQNAIDQAKIFHQFTPLTGIILSKLDGTAKGGIAVNIQQQLGVPIQYIGTGEGVADFAPFDPESFVKALFD